MTMETIILRWIESVLHEPKYLIFGNDGIIAY